MSFHKDSQLMAFMGWLSTMMYLQFLWTIGVVLGFVVGGLFPSTVALFSVLRDLLNNRTNEIVKDRFWKVYKESFQKANRLGYLLIGMGALLIVYMRLSMQIQNTLAPIFLFLSYGFLILFLLAVLYIFPIFVHFDLNISQIIQHAVIIMFLSPFQTIKVMVLSMIFGYSIVRFTILLPFISLAIFCYWIMKIVNEAIYKVTIKSYEKER